MKKAILLKMAPVLWRKIKKRSLENNRTVTGEVLTMIEGVMDAEENDKRERKNASKNNKGSI